MAIFGSVLHRSVATDLVPRTGKHGDSRNTHSMRDKSRQYAMALQRYMATWLACGIIAFEIKRFGFAIVGPLLCALALPVGYWTGGVDYNPSIPVLACSYIGAFFVGFAIRWKIQTEQRKTDLAIAQEQVRRQQKRLKRNSHTARFHRRSYDICDSAVSQERALREQRHFATD